MKRITITVDDELFRAIELRFGKKEFINFSAVIRKLLRNSHDLFFSCICAGCNKEISIHDLQYTESLGFICPVCGSSADRIKDKTRPEANSHGKDNPESS